MAQSTWLQLVSGEEIQELRADPRRINRLDKPDWYSTHFGAALNYFLTGDPWPGPDDHELWPVLGGTETIACPTLENNAFMVVASDVAAQLAARLATVDLASVEAAVGQADFDELVDEQELYELELITPEEAPEIIVSEITRLTAFYAKARASQLGVVMYTS
ncbi:DUF1877 family protein [Nocardia xishanensis]|uniref:DUF1877 family protein n=1 Tax=Nocardia xishanensis TaxID=238964 RepID=UPI0034435C2E